MSLCLTEAKISLKLKIDGGHFEIQDGHHKNARIMCALFSKLVCYSEALCQISRFYHILNNFSKNRS